MSKLKTEPKQAGPRDFWAEIKVLRQKFAALSTEVSAAKSAICGLLKKQADQKSEVLRLLSDGEPESAIEASQKVKSTKAEIAAAQQSLDNILSKRQHLLDERRDCLSAIREEIPLCQAKVDSEKKGLLDMESCKNNLIGLLGEIHNIRSLTPVEIKAELENSLSTGPDCWPSKKTD